jgi:hypothetical protein
MTQLKKIEVVTISTKYLVSDTITEFRTYEVEAESYEKAAELVELHATDNPDDLTGGLVLVDRGITDRFQQDETGSD